MKQISPRGHRILVKVAREDEKTAGGLYKPVEYMDRKKQEGSIGTLVAIGNNAWKAFDDGTPWAKVGDTVLCVKHAGISFDGFPDYRLMNDEDLLGVLEEVEG